MSFYISKHETLYSENEINKKYNKIINKLVINLNSIFNLKIKKFTYEIDYYSLYLESYFEENNIDECIFLDLFKYHINNKFKNQKNILDILNTFS